MDNGLFSELHEALHYAFMQRALLAGVFTAVCCSFLGAFLVLRRFSLIGDGLAHVAFATMALALVLHTSPMLLSVPLVMLASLWILRLSERANLFGDAAIGLVSSLGVALGVLIASLGKGFNVDLFSYLFGNILAISRAEVITSVALSALVTLVVSVFYHDLFAITFEEEHARVQGINADRLNRMLILCTALTIVLGIKVVGTMLVSSLIVLPAVTALQVARSFRGVIAGATLVAVASVVIGILTAYVLDLPGGATIVLVNFAFFVLAFALGRLRR